MDELDSVLTAIRKDSVPQFSGARSLTLRQFLRRNLLLLLATLIFLGIMAMVFIQVDTVNYANEKQEIISRLISEGRLLGDGSRDELSTQAEGLFQRFTAKPEPGALLEMQRGLLLAECHRAMQAVMDSNPMVVRLTMRDGEGRLFLEENRPERTHQQNDWSNSLFARDWVRTLSNQKRIQKQPIGTIELLYTTPRGVPEIEELTRKWWRRVLALAVGMPALYALLLWWFLLPVRRVIQALDKGPALGAPIIEKPRTLLEKYYNNLGRDATLSLFSTGLREFVSRRALVDPQPLLEFTPRLLHELFPALDSAVWTFRRQTEESWTPDSVRGPGGAVEPPVELAGPVLACAQATDPAGPGRAPSGEILKPAACFAETVGGEEGVMNVLVIRRPGAPLSHWWQDYLHRISREVRYALRTVAEQRRLILQEKSKANISLSRNIGHDLTNIIATGKLDLMTLKALLDMSPADIQGDLKKQRIFSESLHALLNNTRFLQEIVNLYRSFTYLSRPKFEQVELKGLIEDVSALFRLSVSRSITVQLEVTEGLEPIEVEPRLLRLALFNLLSNAADSIKRASSTDRPSGEIWLGARPGTAPDTQEIFVRDNGGGIRGRDGAVLKPGEIDEIFRLGFTTKEKDSGEGLGLSWVQQIVRDFHDGTITARNLPEGGALFAITLPARVRDTAPNPAQPASAPEGQPPP